MLGHVGDMVADGSYFIVTFGYKDEVYLPNLIATRLGSSNLDMRFEKE